MGFCQAFCHIFTSPSSASRDDLTSDIMSTSRWRDVANPLHMNNQVTPCSIAYSVTQVCWYLPVKPSVFADCFLPPSARFCTWQCTGVEAETCWLSLLKVLQLHCQLSWGSLRWDVTEGCQWAPQVVESVCSFSLSLEYDGLITPFLSSKVFPPAQTNGPASHDATQSSLKMLEEAHARRALRSAVHGWFC